MLSEQNFLQDQIAILRKRLNAVNSNPPLEKPAADKTIKAYEIRNKVVANLRRELVEILGREDASAMIEEAERDAEVWWSMSRSEQLKPCIPTE